MSLRYSGVNIIPDPTGKYGNSISQGGGLHYFMSWIGLRFSNRRAALIALSVLEALHIMFLGNFNDAVFNAINGLVGTIIGIIIGRKV